ncbi:hypothetical protein DFO70_11487 [Cytobacillus firmus]|uniref:Uncharacterized protein n=2 Tax=Cytobacillus TaxID=2675230 RepID=A0A366JMP9_CYTFI|nr:hypothetical protein DFO70_11487 [Cytobacillus firmus]TDX38533.1 hypothetical protein DFO72_11287 [Cytobacillus oceanisediminis]
MYKKFENSFENTYNKKTNQFILKDNSMLGSEKYGEKAGSAENAKKEQEHPS